MTLYSQDSNIKVLISVEKVRCLFGQVPLQKMRFYDITISLLAAKTIYDSNDGNTSGFMTTKDF